MGANATTDNVHDLDASPLDLTGHGPRLVAGRAADGTVTFPLRPDASGRTERILLPRYGRLWTWTTQEFPPPAPYSPDRGAYEPFAVGYLEIPDFLRVQGRLLVDDIAALRIGMDMVVVEFHRHGWKGYAFAPVIRGEESE